MKNHLFGLNKMIYVFFILMIGLGWKLIWPDVTQFWNLYGSTILIHWFVISLFTFSFVTFLYLLVWYGNHDMPFKMSIVNAFRSIGLKRFIILATLTILVTPPYFYWMFMIAY